MRWHRQQRRGAILLFTLVMVMAAVALALRLQESVLLEIRAQSVTQGQSEFRATGFSALQATMALLAEIEELDGGLYAPSQGWGNPLQRLEEPLFGDLQVNVMITDETGKIPVNAVLENDTLLREFLMGYELPGSAVDEMIDSLQDWVDSNETSQPNGAEKDFYEFEDPPLEPPNEPIDSWDAFRYIRGWRDTMFDENGAPLPVFNRFRQAATLHETSAVNYNSLPPAVVRALDESGAIDLFMRDSFVQGDDGIVGTEDDEAVRSADELGAAGVVDQQGIGYRAELLRVDIEVTDGGRSYRLNTLISARNATRGNPANGPEGAAEQGDTEEEDDNARRIRTINRGSLAESRSRNQPTNLPYTILELSELAELE